MQIKRHKYSFFLISFFLIYLSNQLFGGIVIYDCNGIELRPNESDIGDIHRKRAERVINEINSNDCLPKDWKDAINNFIKSKYETRIQLTCDENFKDCGEGDFKSSKITIPKYYNNRQSSCGCEEATILHELLHACAQVADTAKNDKKIRGCEVKCTTNIPRCQKYPPSGAACDCPK